MSRRFDGSTQYGTTASVPVTAVPLTLACWVYPEVSANFFSIAINNATTLGDSFELNYNAGASHSNAAVRQSGSYSEAEATAAANFNAWNHVCGVFPTNSLRRSYINGGNVGSDSTTLTPTAASLTNVDFAVLRAGGSNFSMLQGRIADAAIWNVDLAASEVAALAAGARPFEIRPLNLVGFWPMDGLVSPEPDLSGGKRIITLVASPTLQTGPPTTLFTPKSMVFFPPPVASTSRAPMIVRWD